MMESKTAPVEAITTRIYRALYELNRHGRKPAAIYLGHFYKNELDKIARKQTGMYGSGVENFADVPVYYLVGHDKHFNVVAEHPYAY